jgi:hypothetical protein
MLKFDIILVGGGAFDAPFFYADFAEGVFKDRSIISK